MTGRARVRSQSPYPSRVTGVDPAVVRRRRSDLPRETCVVVPVTGLREPKGTQSAAQESAEGILGGGNEPENRKSHPTEGPNGLPEGANGAASRDGHLMSDMRQNIQRQLASARRGKGEAQSASTGGSESLRAVRVIERRADTEQLMEEVCERHNLKRALRRVRSNKGSPGIDGMTVEELPGYLRAHGPVIRKQLLHGTYHPKPVRRVEIPTGTFRMPFSAAASTTTSPSRNARLLSASWSAHKNSGPLTRPMNSLLTRSTYAS